MRRALLVTLVAACTCPGRATQPTTPAAIVEPPSQPRAATPVEPARPVVTSEPDVPSGAAAARDAELATRVVPILDAYATQQGLLSRDGKTLVFISDRDGLPQLYRSDTARPDSPAVRLVTTTERVGQFALTRDGKSVVFASDKGADENWEYFKVDLDGKNLIQLTSGEPLNRDTPLLRDGQPNTVFFSARKASEAASTAYSLPLQSGATPNRIYSEPGTGFLADVTTDGKWGAWIRYPSHSAGTVILVDLSLGTTRPVYPTAGEAGIRDATFSYDGKRLYIATDGGGDQSLVLAFDTKTLKEVGRYLETRPATATLSDSRTSKKGNLFAIGVQAGNHDEIRILDGKTLKPKVEVKVPLGEGRLGDFSEDGKRLTLTWTTPDSPRDVFVVDVKSGAVAPLRADARPTLQALGKIDTRIETIKAHDGLEIPVNVYLPAGAAASGKKLPVVVEYHGGPSAYSAVGWDPGVRFLVSLGYAYVQPNVRGSGGFGRSFEMADNGPKREEAFTDVETSGRWVAAQPWADKDKLVVMGASYGGYTVLIALTRQAALWRAGVDLVGVTDLKTFLASTTGVIREVFKTEFGDLEKDQALLESQSPLRDVDKIVDPLFVYAGANDPRVPRSESDQIVKALRTRGIPVEYYVAMDEGHSIDRRETKIALFSRTARFLETVLAK